MVWNFGYLSFEEWVPLRQDQTLFIKKNKGDILLVQVYVDDIIFGSTKKEMCKEFEKLMKDQFQMSSMGELTSWGYKCRRNQMEYLSDKINM